MCFVVDDDSLGYYLMFNIPIVLYFLIFLYTWIIYESSALKRKPVTNVPHGADTEQNLLPKPSANTLTPALYNKIR